MSSSKIVCTGPIEPIATEILGACGEIVIAPDPSEETVISLLGDASALVVRGEGKASAKTIAAAPKLRVIGRSGVGYNNVDIAAATARRIPVVYTPGAGARAVAEASLSLMLALAKRLTYWDQQLKAGNWNSRFEISTGDLDGATLGIVGFGRIGQLVAELAKPFEMTILAYDPYAPAEAATRLGVKLTGIDELMRSANFITLHAAATEETRALINRDRLKMVQPGTFLVNLARGDLIESLDILHEAVEDGRLAGVGLDVFLPEPPDVSHPIFRLPNCLTAPHSLGMSRKAMARIFKSMADDMAAVLRGKRPQFVVNPEVL